MIIQIGTHIKIQLKIKQNITPRTNYQELEQIVYSTVMKTIGMYKYNSNQVYNNKNTKTARQQKRTAKKELQQAIKKKKKMI